MNSHAFVAARPERVVKWWSMRLLFIAVALALNGTAVAQQSHDPLEPTKTLPKSYKVEFENDWVRAVRVHYDAKANLPEHEHPAGITVYLILNASDGVLFTQPTAATRSRGPGAAGRDSIGHGRRNITP